MTPFEVAMVYCGAGASLLLNVFQAIALVRMRIELAGVKGELHALKDGFIIAASSPAAP